MMSTGTAARQVREGGRERGRGHCRPEAKDRGGGAPRARNALSAAPGVHAPRSSLPSLRVAAGPGALIVTS